MKQNRRQLGMAGEEKAAQYLLDEGYLILERNWRCQSGELDIIASENGCLVFAEVRTRTIYKGILANEQRYGSVLEAITYRKQVQLKKLAEIYMYQRKIRNQSVRFDVILIERTGEEYKVNHFKHAF